MEGDVNGRRSGREPRPNGSLAKSPNNSFRTLTHCLQIRFGQARIGGFSLIRLYRERRGPRCGARGPRRAPRPSPGRARPRPRRVTRRASSSGAVGLALAPGRWAGRTVPARPSSIASLSPVPPRAAHLTPHTATRDRTLTQAASAKVKHFCAPLTDTLEPGTGHRSTSADNMADNHPPHRNRNRNPSSPAHTRTLYGCSPSQRQSEAQGRVRSACT